MYPTLENDVGVSLTCHVKPIIEQSYQEFRHLQRAPHVVNFSDF